MKQQYDFSNAEVGRFYRPDAKLRKPASGAEPKWEGAEGRIGRFLVEEASKTLAAYRVQPNLVNEHANHEHDTAHGGYAHRQLFELVQDSADALSHAGTGQSILIRLTEKFLYCADDGQPIDENGVRGLMFAHMSSKRGTSEIGRFGLGFKSVLGVSDAPEFFSRSGSIRFDGKCAAERIRQVVAAERYPALRLPDPIDPRLEAERDEELQELMDWAVNIVRLPLKAGAHDDLAAQIRKFPPEFLLFVPHVRYLTLEAGKESREFRLQEADGEFQLDTGKGVSRWRCFHRTHQLSADAKADSRSLDDSKDVTIAWAAPLDGLSKPGNFWAFFPTRTASLLAGILNAPWKTNEDRQYLLPGPYNDELIDAAAELVAKALPRLSLPTDPAKHQGALPRLEEAGDGEHSKPVREKLIAMLRFQPMVPDYDECLRDPDKILRDINRILGEIVGIEKRLSEQIRSAIDKRGYSDLAGLAAISQKVHEAIDQICQQVNASTKVPAPTPAPASQGAAKGRKAKAKEAAPAEPKRRHQASKRGYPKFSRQGDNLVKTEWNNVKNAEQRHRVSFATVSQLVGAINDNGGQVFRKNLLQGVTTADGKKLPMHQLYIVLGWLLSSKAIAKKGRRDYHPDQRKLTPMALRQSFEELKVA